MADSRCWSREVLTGFINLYRRLPCLWKVKSKDYTNRNVRNEAYDKLASFCQPIFPEANRDFVYKKIQSLRGSFRKEAKKVADSKCSGNGSDVYVPTLWYYDLLLFTLDQDTPNNSISNADEDGTSLLEEGDSEEANNSKGPVAKNLEVAIRHCSTVLDGNITDIEDAKREENIEQGTIKAERLATKRKCDDCIDDGIYKVVLKRLQEEPDEYDKFGQYVALELKSMNSDFSKAKLKSEIRKVIARIADEDMEACFSMSSS